MKRPYVLVTGGAHADIGKGTVGAMLGRGIARGGRPVDYVKIDPCLQGDLGDLPNTAFGEIVVTPDGHAIDGDVARAAFLVPGFVPGPDSQCSLGRTLAAGLASLHAAGATAPRLAEVLDRLCPADGDRLPIIEIGGTAGEPEHRLVVDALLRRYGAPALHVHVTAELVAAGHRRTTKPAQLSLAALPLPPEIVLVRGTSAPPPALKAMLPDRAALVPLADDPASPEWSAYRALCAAPVAALLRQRLGAAPAAETPPAAADLEVAVVDDGGGPEAYASLVRRLRGWSGGRIAVRFGPPGPDTAAVVRIGETSPSTVDAADFEVLEVVPGERARDPAARPDWRGTLDAPSGPVADFVARVLRGRSRPAAQSTHRPMAYAIPDFARRYLRASDAGRLRDHAILDALVWRALPAPGALKGARILDLGCGAGRWSARLVEAGAHVVGVEPSAPMADAAAARGLPRFELVRCEAERYRPDGLFDAVLAMMSLDHVADLPGVLRTLSPHLAPGARVVAATEHPLRTAPRHGPRWIEEPDGRAARVRDYGRPGWRALRWFDRPEPVWVRHRTIEEWVAAFVGAGLELVAVREPVSDDPRDGGNPRFWLLVAQKPRRGQ